MVRSRRGLCQVLWRQVRESDVVLLRWGRWPVLGSISRRRNSGWPRPLTWRTGLTAALLTRSRDGWLRRSRRMRLDRRLSVSRPSRRGGPSIALGPPNRFRCRQAPLLRCGLRSQRISRLVGGCLTAHGVARQLLERLRLHVPLTVACCRPRRSGFLIDSHGESIRESGVTLAP